MMRVLTVHEELIRTIETLTEEQALALLQVARVMLPAALSVEQQGKANDLLSGPDDEWIDRVRAFRARIEARGVVVPDVVATLDEIWEERCDDISGLR